MLGGAGERKAGADMGIKAKTLEKSLKALGGSSPPSPRR